MKQPPLVSTFTASLKSYNKNGNITTLQRYGQTTALLYGLIDNLTFTLNGNQLNRVDDAVSTSAYNNGFEFKDAVKQAGEYAYDANGNLTKDLNKGISSIQYNILNLPSSITFTDGSITYLYSADGTKLRTIHKTGSVSTTTDYCGNVIYENDAPKQLLTEEGYVSLSDKKYHYYLKDHQGNNRVLTSLDATGKNWIAEETNHYYPFGGVYAGTGNVQPYRYNGKELDAKKGLNWYDYGARHYDAALGRFMTVDPMAEKMYSWSPYNYCLNNPEKYIDKDGNLPWVAGAIGGGLDYLFQVAGNRYQGKSWGDSFTDIDMKSVLVSAATSMTGVGLSNVVSKGLTLSRVAQASTRAAQIAKVAGEVTVDATLSVTSQMVMDGEVSAKKVATDIITGQIASRSGNMIKAKHQASETGKLLHRQADHARRVAGNNPRPSRAQRANEAAQKVQNHGESARIATSTAISTVGSKSIDTFKDLETNWEWQSAVRKK